MRQINGWHVCRIEISLQFGLPAALRAECGKLMLPQDMSSKAIRISLGIPLAVGQETNLAVRLLEGLSNCVLFEPSSPGDDFLRRSTGRMPKLNSRVVTQVLNGLSARINELAFVPNSI